MGRQSADIMRPGYVMTVEPGLYYHGIGGVRIEDVILIRKGKPKILSQFEKVLEI
jgi:Xaa-Pro aminopeptidase